MGLFDWVKQKRKGKPWHEYPPRYVKKYYSIHAPGRKALEEDCLKIFGCANKKCGKACAARAFRRCGLWKRRKGRGWLGRGAAAFGGQAACGGRASQTKRGPGAMAPGPRFRALRARRRPPGGWDLAPPFRPKHLLVRFSFLQTKLAGRPAGRPACIFRWRAAKVFQPRPPPPF